jgi:hypothetical protein
MTGNVVATLSILAVTNLALGWYLGYRSIPSYLTFWCLCGFVGITACRIIRCVFPWAGLADAILRAGLLFFALVVLAGLALGGVGLVGVVPYLVFFAGCFAVSTTLKTPRATPEPSASRIPVQTWAILLPLLTCVVAVGLIQSPLTLYDSLSYHLLFPARWLQEHQISIVPTPFSDPAQAYQPANGELYFLWLMIPFHGDLVARIGHCHSCGRLVHGVLPHLQGV